MPLIIMYTEPISGDILSSVTISVVTMHRRIIGMIFEKEDAGLFEEATTYAHWWSRTIFQKT